MVSGRDALLSALAAHGPARPGVTDVVFSHHHPDHTINAALFPGAVIHDHWASYDGDLWIGREPGDFALTPSVRLIATPGHTAEDITTLAATPDGVYACTHAWWGPDGPAEDPLGHRPGRAAPEPGPDPGGGHGDHPWPRPRLPPRPGHPPLTPGPAISR